MPNTILIYLLGLAGLFGAGYYTGHRQATLVSDAAMTKQYKDAMYAVNVRTKALALMSAQLEKAKNERTVEYRTLTKEVDRVVTKPVYRNACFDDLGLRIANTALAGGHAAAASELDANLPQPAGDNGH